MTEQKGLHAGLVRVLPEALSARGLDPAPVWLALGLSDQDTHEHDRVPAAALTQALHVSAQLSGDPHIGLQAAQAVRPTHLGSLGYALMSVAAGVDGLRLYEAAQALINNELLSHHRVHEGRVEVHHAMVHGQTPRDPAFWQFQLLSRLSFARWVSGRHLVPLRLDLPCAPPPDPHPFEQWVSCQVRYDAPNACEVMPIDWLDWLNPNADATMHTLMRTQAERMLQQVDSNQVLLLRCKQAIGEMLPTSEPITLAVLSEHLASRQKTHMDPAQLQRQLSVLGTHLKDLVEDTRRERALHALRHSSQAIKQIALDTGYAETSSFHRAIKRWTGLTPAQLRQEATAFPRT